MPHTLIYRVYYALLLILNTYPAGCAEVVNKTAMVLQLFSSCQRAVTLWHTVLQLKVGISCSKVVSKGIVCVPHRPSWLIDFPCSFVGQLYLRPKECISR